MKRKVPRVGEWLRLRVDLDWHLQDALIGGADAGWNMRRWDRDAGGREPTWMGTDRYGSRGDECDRGDECQKAVHNN